MASISSLGTGSGVLTSKLLEDLVAADRKPLEARIKTRQDKHDAVVSEYGTLKGLASTFQSAAAALSTATGIKSKKASSANDTLVGATASTLAQSGNYSVSVSQLAQAQSLASKRFTSINDVVGTGNLTFTFGTTDASYDPATSSTYAFTADAERTSKTVSIDTAHNSVVGIRDAINASNIGIQASIVNDGTGYRLVFASSQSGAKNSFQIGVSGASGSLGDLAFDTASVTGGSAQTSQSIAAKDALFTVNGVAASRPSNLVTEVISGVTLNLKQTTSGAVNISVGQDTDAVSKRMEEFVKAYNELKTHVNEVTSFDTKTKQAGLLLGDSAVTTMMSQLRRQLSQVVDGLGMGTSSLSAVGLSSNAKTGLLTYDSSVFIQKLSSAPSDIAGLLAADGRPTDSLINYGTSSSATKAGTYDIKITQLASQAVYQGMSVSALDAGNINIDSSNSSFKVKINGTTSATLQLTEQVYASASDVATEIQRQINNDSALVEAGASVSVTYNSTDKRFDITSNKYGARSNVSIVTNDDAMADTLGLVTSGQGRMGSALAGLSTTAFGSGVVVDTSNQSFQLKLGSVTSGTISIAAGTYNDGASLASAIQSAINADSALSAAGKSATVTYSGDASAGRFGIRFGSGDELSFTNVPAATETLLGFSTTSESDTVVATGKDVAGTLGGVVGVGVGQTLYAGSTSDAVGLSIKVTGGELGDRGSITFIRGVAASLSKTLSGFLNEGGLLSNKTDGLNKEQAEIDKLSKTMEARSEALRKRLQASFTYNDTLVSQLTSTGNYVKQQLAALSGSNSNN